MKVFEAPNEPSIEEYYDEHNIKLFLAGGITNCEDWQSKVIDELNNMSLDNLLVFNPRRKDFDITDKDASRKQIEWEFKHLNNMDIFTMYFAKSENSVQPICMYELGRHLERMQHRFPKDWKDRIIIGIEDGYSRTQDVIIQSNLALGCNLVFEHINPESYARLICLRYQWISYMNGKR